MSTDTMSTMDNQVLTEILSTLKGLSPPSIKGITSPPILGTINKSIKNLSGSFDKSIEPLIKSVDLVTEAVNLVTEAVNTLKPDEIIEGIKMALSAIGVGVGILALPGVLPAAAPIVSTSGAVLGGGAMAGLAAAMGTVGLIVASIVAIVASIALVVIYWKDIKAFGSKFMKVFKEIGTILKQIIIDYFKNLGDALNTIATNFANTIMLISNTIKTTIMQVVTDIVSTAQFIGDSILQIGNIIGTTIVNLITNMTQHFVDLGTNLATIFVTHIVDPIKTGLNILMDKLKGPITWFFDQLKKLTSLGIGGAIGKLFGGDDSTEQISPQSVNQVIAPISAPSTALLSTAPKSIINKASVAPKSIPQISPTIPLAPNLAKVATVVNMPNKKDLVDNGKIVNANFTTSMFSNSSNGGTKGASSSISNATNNYQTVYNIANVDIADGVIYEIEDFLASIRNAANKIRTA